jgi:hypothetical protein
MTSMGQMKLGAAMLASTLVVLLAAAGAADAKRGAFTGEAAGGRVQVALAVRGGGTTATISLSQGLAARVAEHSVRLSCGRGDYGTQPLVIVRWPSRKLAVQLGAAPAPDGVDRCRLQSGKRLSVRMQMHPA